MSLTRRKWISWVLVFLIALSWTGGQHLLRRSEGMPVTSASTATDVSHVNTAESSQPGTDVTTHPTGSFPTAPAEDPSEDPGALRRERLGGYLLSCGAALAAIVTVLFIFRREPLLGPDGTMLVLAFLGLIQRDLLENGSGLDLLLYFLFSTLVILSLLELWGWIRGRLRLSWCALYRIVRASPSGQASVLWLCLWNMALAVGIGLFLTGYDPMSYAVTLVCLLAAMALGAGCLWQFGAELQHLRRQLRNAREALPVDVRDGIFSRDEAGLRDLRLAHEEAVRTAVISERFKVELIANVSHDLRTPLTSILGYGELLRQEALSPTGREQLERLNQKTGYMRDLVESLFELTKVSSGVTECRKAPIDLIRLLEQTIGLFDDQLTRAGLQVRRHYARDAVSVVTDGARMHQVFANLLGNAVKYALPTTRIHLEVKENGESCTVRMVNTASYEMDFQPEDVMQRFSRGDKARSTQGSGLGLAIAQTYTESVGGTFHIAIDGDQFSAVVTLPLTDGCTPP